MFAKDYQKVLFSLYNYTNEMLSIDLITVPLLPTIACIILEEKKVEIKRARLVNHLLLGYSRIFAESYVMEVSS